MKKTLLADRSFIDDFQEERQLFFVQNGDEFARNFGTAERLLEAFGQPPVGVACPLAHFAQPFGKTHVAVVQVADRAGGGFGLRFLVLAAELYRAVTISGANASRSLYCSAFQRP